MHSLSWSFNLHVNISYLLTMILITPATEPTLSHHHEHIIDGVLSITQTISPLKLVIHMLVFGVSLQFVGSFRIIRRSMVKHRVLPPLLHLHLNFHLFMGRGRSSTTIIIDPLPCCSAQASPALDSICLHIIAIQLFASSIVDWS